MSKLEELVKFIKSIDANKVRASKSAAEDLLKHIDSPELATKLVGEDKQKYLDALDMAQGGREARAKDMGFGDRTWYHGTTVPIDQFKNEAKGISTGAQSAKKGFFFAQDPSTASDYADLARDHGIIREGDNVTTRFLSDTAELHNDAYDLAKDHAFERDNRLGNIQRQEERNQNTQKIIKYVEADGDPDKRLPELQKKLADGQSFIEKNRKEAEEFDKKISALDDKIGSGGQQVGAYRLKGSPENIHVKDYKDQGYRDTSYANEMQNALDQNKTGVLFRNTYDAADPNNKIKQDIAAVFEPNQVRSTNAAFDKRFAKSPLLLAGAGAAPIDQISPIGPLKSVASAYNQAKSKAADYLANQMDFTPDKSQKGFIGGVLGAALDPVNLIPGAAGVGVGALQMLGDEKDLLPMAQEVQRQKLLEQAMTIQNSSANKVSTSIKPQFRSN